MKRAFSKNITAWLYSAILFIVLFSVLSTVIPVAELPRFFAVIFQLGLEFATFLFKDPLLPLILCIIFFVDVMLYQWRLETNIIKPLLNACLLAGNLVICLTQISFSRENLVVASIFLVGAVFCILLGHFIKQKRIANRTVVPPEGDAETEQSLPGNSVYEIKRCYAKKRAETELQLRVELLKEKKSQKLERLKKKNEKKLIKAEKAVESAKGTANPSHKTMISSWIFWSIYWACIAIPFVITLVLGVLSPVDGEPNPLNKILASIASFFGPFKDNEPVVSVISALGGLFLWIIAFFLIFYLLIVIGRIIRKAITKSDADTTSNDIAADEIKVFMHGLIQSALYIVLIIPDFLRSTIDLLFDIDPISEIVDNWRNPNKKLMENDGSPEEKQASSESEVEE